MHYAKDRSPECQRLFDAANAMHDEWLRHYQARPVGDHDEHGHLHAEFRRLLSAAMEVYLRDHGYCPGEERETVWWGTTAICYRIWTRAAKPNPRCFQWWYKDDPEHKGYEDIYNNDMLGTGFDWHAIESTRRERRQLALFQEEL
jgi:hypothetical protein